MREIRLVDLGTMDYFDCWELQKRLVAQRAQDEILDQLILVEHPHAVTLGRKQIQSISSLPNSSFEIPIYEIERGGEATYHGPGQLVGYPILKLEADRRDLHAYLRNLEEVLIRTLADFSIKSRRIENATGVWLKTQIPKKIASIGIAVKRWVTYHGFALNVSTDLDYFKLISPCGYDSSVMTSIERERTEPIAMSAVKDRVIAHFQSAFDVEVQSNSSVAQ